jgi:hypothetical protein
LLKCTDLPEGPGSATEPLDAQTLSCSEEFHLQRISSVCLSRLFGLAFAFSARPGRRQTRAGVRAFSRFHLRRIAPRKLQRLVGSGLPIRIPFALKLVVGSPLSRRSIALTFSTPWKKESANIRFLEISRSNVLADARETFFSEPGDI